MSNLLVSSVAPRGRLHDRWQIEDRAAEVGVRREDRGQQRGTPTADVDDASKT